MTVNGQLVSFRAFGSDILDTAVPAFTGVLSTALGFNDEGAITVTQPAPLDLTVWRSITRYRWDNNGRARNCRLAAGIRHHPARQSNRRDVQQADQTLVQGRARSFNRGNRSSSTARTDQGARANEQRRDDKRACVRRIADPFSGSIVHDRQPRPRFSGLYDDTRQSIHRAESDHHTEKRRHQAAQFRAAGKAAKRSAMFSAITSVGMSLGTYGMMGGPSGQYSLFNMGGGGAPTSLLGGAGGASSPSGFFSAPMTRPTRLPGIY